LLHRIKCKFESQMKKSGLMSEEDRESLYKEPTVHIDYRA